VFGLGVAAVVVLGGVGLFAWRQRRRAPLVAFAIFFGLVAIAPVANVFFRIGTIFGERLAYLPAAALLVLLCLGADAVRARIGTRRAASATKVAFAAAFVLCVVRSNLRNRDWRSALDLFASAVAAAPDSFKTHDSYAAEIYLAAARRGDVAARIDLALA